MGEEFNRGRGATEAAGPQYPLAKPPSFRPEEETAAAPPSQSAATAPLPAAEGGGGTAASASADAPLGRRTHGGETSGRFISGTAHLNQQQQQHHHPSTSARSPRQLSAAIGETYHVRRRHESSAGGQRRRAAEDFEENKEDLGFSNASVDKKDVKDNGCCACGCPRQTFSDFMQQRLPAWQPVLSPCRILTVLGVCGFVFLGLGILILVCSNKIIECKVDYTHETQPEVLLRIGPEHCSDTSAKEIKGDVYLFFELHNMYQNHRRYLKSRSDSQLQGKVYTNPGDVKTACDPRYLAEDGRVLDPCGLNAVAVFTDAYSVWKDSTTKGELVPIELDETRETICWHFDLRSRFKNPSPAERQKYADKVAFWLFQPEMRKALHMDIPGVGEGVENSHFIVWMREAALPEFRKIYGKIKESPLKLPFYVRVSGNNYDVQSFGGKKYVVVSQSSWLGGRNSFLGITYIVVACVCIVVFLLLGYIQMRNPRHMGDVSWLRKALYADG